MLHNPNIADVATACGLPEIRVEDPIQVRDALHDAFAHEGPALIDIVRNPEEVAVPGKVKLAQGWGLPSPSRVKFCRVGVLVKRI